MDYKALIEKAGALFFLQTAVRQWRFQRITAVALVPLTVWLILLLNKALHSPYAETVDWLTNPLNGLPVMAWTVTVIYHAVLGLHVVIEDYVSVVNLRHRLIYVTNLIFLLIGGVALLTLIMIVLKLRW